MSREARDWVRKHTPATGTCRLVLAELARWAPGADGLGVWIANSKLADETGRSRRTVQRALAELERDDLIRRHQGGPDHCEACTNARRGIVVYDVVIPQQAPAVSDRQMSLLGGAATSVTDVRHMAHVVAHVGEPDVRHGDVGTCATVTHKRTGAGEGQQQLGNAREHSSELAATVERVVEALTPTRLFVDRYAIEGAVMANAHRDVDAAVLSIVALASDPAYRLPKGGAAKMLLDELRRQAERPPSSPRFARPGAPAPAELPDRFAKYDVAMGLA